MQLKPGSYLILGMVHEGVRTGYAIKRTVDRSTRFFWAASLAQVYPELAALESDDYLTSENQPQGARPRKVYRLTDKGRGALQAWLRSERTPDFEQRDEGLLRLFFADAIPLDEAIELVRRMRRRAEEIDQAFRESILPLATERARGRFPVITAREGAEYYAWRAAWFRKIEKELVDELATTSEET